MIHKAIFHVGEEVYDTNRSDVAIVLEVLRVVDSIWGDFFTNKVKNHYNR